MMPSFTTAVALLWIVAAFHMHLSSPAKAPPPLIPRMPQTGPTCTLLPQGWPLVPRHAPMPDLTCEGRFLQPLRAAFATFLTQPSNLAIPTSDEAPPFTYFDYTYAWVNRVLAVSNNQQISIVILATPDVPKSLLAKLVELNPTRVVIATVAPVELNLKSFVSPATGEDLSRWRYSGGKLGAFNLTQFDRVFLMDSDSFLLNDADSVFCNVPMLGDTAHLDDMTRIHDATQLDGGEDHAAVPPTVGGQALRRFGYAAATERKPPPKQAVLPDHLRISASTKDNSPILPPAPAPLLHSGGPSATIPSSPSFKYFNDSQLLPSNIPSTNSLVHDHDRRHRVPGVLYSSVALLQPNEATYLHLLSTLEQMVKEHRTMSSRGNNKGPIGDQDVMIEAFLGNMSCLPPRYNCRQHHANSKLCFGIEDESWLRQAVDVVHAKLGVCGVAKLLPRAHMLWLEALPPGRLRHVIDQLPSTGRQNKNVDPAVLLRNHDEGNSINRSGDAFALSSALCPPKVAGPSESTPSLLDWATARLGVGRSDPTTSSSMKSNAVNENGRRAWELKNFFWSLIGLVVLSLFGARISGLWSLESSRHLQRSR